MCSRGPCIRRIPYKSGQFFLDLLFVKKNLGFISQGLLWVAEAIVYTESPRLGTRSFKKRLHLRGVVRT
jgi:hypothetical protein